mmetsp:Transcript_54722/g.125668  ORF Transcript_54722/g.125668 Transcript_54722/m.125668 type:complete len:334 (-) Transcript_54722:308-1309(-)
MLTSRRTGARSTASACWWTWSVGGPWTTGSRGGSGVGEDPGVWRSSERRTRRPRTQPSGPSALRRLRPPLRGAPAGAATTVPRIATGTIVTATRAGATAGMTGVDLAATIGVMTVTVARRSVAPWIDPTALEATDPVVTVTDRAATVTVPVATAAEIETELEGTARQAIVTGLAETGTVIGTGSVGVGTAIVIATAAVIATGSEARRKRRSRTRSRRIRRRTEAKPMSRTSARTIGTVTVIVAGIVTGTGSATVSARRSEAEAATRTRRRAWSTIRTSKQARCFRFAFFFGSVTQRVVPPRGPRVREEAVCSVRASRLLARTNVRSRVGKQGS